MSRARGRIVLVCCLLAASLACSRPSPRTAPEPGPTIDGAALVRLHERHRVDGLETRAFEPEHYWELLMPILRRDPERFRVQQVGRSIEGRPIRRVDFGRGEERALLWSQMHGDESTASRALVDVFAFLAAEPDHPAVRRLEDRLTITVIPVLNPDGAARFRRHNAIGVDVNRDARRQATPEGRALKTVRDAVDAPWGFNLHDQNVRTRLGDTDRDVLIALLTPPPGSGETSRVMLNAQHLAAVVVDAVEPVVGDQVAKYDESFNPRAFGDLMTRWGTGTLLIESGGEPGDPDKSRLRTANFVGILAALDAIATGAWRRADPAVYRSLPRNGRDVYDLLVLGASVVIPGAEPVRADLAVNYRDTLAREGGRVVEVGDLEDAEALHSIDATGLFFLPDTAALSSREGKHLAIGDTASGVLARDPEGREIVWRLDEGRPERAE